MHHSCFPASLGSWRAQNTQLASCQHSAIQLMGQDSRHLPGIVVPSSIWPLPVGHFLTATTASDTVITDDGQKGASLTVRPGKGAWVLRKVLEESQACGFHCPGSLNRMDSRNPSNELCQLSQKRGPAGFWIVL